MSFRDPQATWLGSPNLTWRRDGNAIQWIVLHTMVGTVASANARFQNAATQASAHYGVGLDGSLVQWVDEGDTAYHAGDYQVNLCSIGIEHEDGGNYNAPRPDALYQRSSSLVAAICSRYGIPVRRGSYPSMSGCIDHRTVYATACPDALDTSRIISQAGRFGGGGGEIVHTTRRRTLTVATPTSLHEFIRGTNTARSLFHRRRAAGIWSPWKDLGGQLQNAEIAGGVDETGAIFVTIQGTDGFLYEYSSRDDGVTWAPPIKAGNGQGDGLLVLSASQPASVGGVVDLSQVTTPLASLQKDVSAVKTVTDKLQATGFHL